VAGRQRLLNKQIAGELGTSEVTVKIHRGHAMKKMQARSFADLCAWARHWSSRLAARLAWRNATAGCRPARPNGVSAPVLLPAHTNV
jgi:hypothetical protein